MIGGFLSIKLVLRKLTGQLKIDTEKGSVVLLKVAETRLEWKISNSKGGLKVLSYRSSATSFEYRASVLAARLVPEIGSAGLPAPFGEIAIEELHDPDRYGLPKVHPLQQMYPNLCVRYFVMVVTESIKVQRGGVRGVSLYVDYRNSGVCAEVTSEMGRNGIAPWGWAGEPGTPTDPAAMPYLEWRRVEEDGNFYIWQNHMVHGIPFGGPDWRDGVPVNLRYMYDQNRGEVLQSILVPVDIPGLGNAEQTIDPSALRSTYSILLWFPKPEYLQFVRRAISKEPYRRDEDEEVGVRTARSYGASKGREAMEAILRQESIQAEFKMASGGRIKQGVNPDLFGHHVWSDQPEVLMVCIPVGEQQVNRLLRPSMPSGRRVF